MKKTLAALAVLGAFAAGSAVAADVTLYGVVDYSLKYSRVDTDKTGEDATNKFEMASGAQSGSRFGLKGTEDLGNGLKVGFVLENGFGADDGTMLQGQPPLRSRIPGLSRGRFRSALLRPCRSARLG